MSAAPELDFEFHAGDTKIIRATVIDSVTSSAKSLVGATLKWWCASRVTSTTNFLEKELGTGITVIGDAVDGVVDITIEKTETTNANAKIYYHELEVVDSAGHRGTVLRGAMTVLKALVT